MAIIKHYTDSLGYPHLMQVTTEEEDPQNGYELGLNYRYTLETMCNLPREKAVKVAQRLFKNNLYYAHDITNVGNRNSLYTIFKNALNDKGQAKRLLTELVYQLTQKENTHGG